MPFHAIAGQVSAIATLQNALAGNRLGHAYLFIGPSGVGKKQTALLLAQTILCTDTPGEGCGACAACTAIVAGSHPDVTIVAPEAGKQMLAIDQVRELQRLLGLRPVRGSKKIALVEEAHLLTPQAQSALLKLVEEPPGDALLVLLTVNAATLSHPLRSRCQQVRFTALPLTVVEELLTREHATAPETARVLARYSRGSLDRALMLDPDVFTEERRYVIEELQQLRGASFTALSRLAEWLIADRTKKTRASADAQEGRPAGVRLELVLAWYEEVLRYLLLGQEGVVRYQDSLTALTQTAASVSVTEALRQLALVYDTMRALGRNANPRLAVEDMLLQLATPQRSR